MTPREFFEETKKLRKLQIAYFKLRTSTALGACKRQEKIIDAEIARVDGIVEKDGQLKFMK